MKSKKRARDRVRYAFKPPKHGRATFSIHEDILKLDGTRKCRTIHDERLRAINESYASGAQDLETCVTQVKEIIKDFYKRDTRCKPQVVHNTENHKVLDDYWEKVYSYRSLENEESTRNELNRAIDILGPLSIYSASRDQIQTAIDQSVSGNVQRRVVQRLSQILKFMGRTDIRLRKARPVFNKVKHVTESEFHLLCQHIDDPTLKTLATLCFYSGVRIGEAFAITATSLNAENKDTIRIASQLDRRGNLKPTTKTRKPRLAFLISGGLEAFEEWVKIPHAQKLKINRLTVSKQIRTACEKAFPGDPDKQLTFHALRHSYAIHLLSRGVSMSLVAQSLGNSLSVCQHYYVGFELTNESVAAIRAIVASSSK
jgi:integrase